MWRQVAGLPRSTTYGARVPASSVVSLSQCLRDIYLKEGVKGFYKGTVPSLVKAAPQAAVTFAAYEFVVGLLLAAAVGDKGGK